jgi:hypothetical protein
MPDLDVTPDGKQAEGEHRSRSDPVRDDHHAPAVEAIADDAADEQEHHHRTSPREPDQRDLARAARQLVRLPGERDEEEAVAEQRDRHPGPEQPEVPDRKGPQHADPRNNALYGRSSSTSANMTPSFQASWRQYALRLAPSRTKPAWSNSRSAASLNP